MGYLELLPQSPATKDARTRARWAAGIINDVRAKKRPPEVLDVLWQVIIGWTDTCPQADIKPYYALAEIARQAKEQIDKRSNR